MKLWMSLALMTVVCVLSMTVAACGDDDGTEADRLGIAAECSVAADCVVEGQTCLTQFKGGYCGVPDCTTDADCPEASACVAHEDGHNYCFRICADKLECNAHRSPDNEANCSSNITFVDGGNTGKACVPPSN